jgi:hypothetical protein
VDVLQSFFKPKLLSEGVESVSVQLVEGDMLVTFKGSHHVWDIVEHCCVLE